MIPEDWVCWFKVLDGLRPDLSYALRTLSRQSDRRDAALMLGIERCRQYERERPERFTEYAGYGWVHSMVDAVIDGGGVTFPGLNITYYA